MRDIASLRYLYPTIGVLLLDREAIQGHYLFSGLAASSRDPAFIVLADENPQHQHTPVTSAHPANNPNSPTAISLDISAQSHTEGQLQPQSTSQEDLSRALVTQQAATLQSISGLGEESRSRRRRRSPSTSSEGTSGPEEIYFGYNSERVTGVRDGSIAEGLRHRRESRSAPKRRRLMTQDMRHELPINSNGTHRQINGSSRLPSKNGATNGANGHSPEANGVSSSQTNGYSPSKTKARSQDFYGHDREEVTRLLIQGLEDLGYNEAAERLSEESGYQVESPSVAAFRHAVLEGMWVEAENLLLGPPPEPDGGGVSINHSRYDRQVGLKLSEEADPDQIRFLIREQKYLELLKKGARAQALMVLQSELQPLNYDTRRLNVLSGYLVSDPSRDVTWTTTADGRRKLLSELSKFVSPSAMIPQHRLADLFAQVHRGQISKCLYHNPSSSRPPSLFVDHMCDQNEFPLRTSMELSHSEGEVWYVDFSHNGKFLAACGQSRTVVVYDTHTFDVRHKLSEHGDNVLYVSWSPDDSKLITCCRDAKARIWDMITGRCTQIVDHQEQGVSCAAWTPDGRYFVSGALDKHAQLCLRPADGRGEPFNWPTALRTQDCAITPNGQKLVVMSTENFITVYDIPSRREEYTIKVAHRMTCISVSRDSTTMLVNMENDEIHLIDIETADIVRKYFGQQQGSFIIRSAFGGADEGLVISGSANSKVYIWHKENGTLIETLDGHGRGCVNAVSWNSANPTMFASGGDDKKVRIWTKDPKPSSLLRRRVSSQSSPRHAY